MKVLLGGAVIPTRRLRAQETKTEASNLHLRRLLAALLLFGTANSSNGAQRKITLAEQLHKNHSMNASYSFSARELADPTGFCCRKAGCKKCNTKSSKSATKCNLKKFSTWCQDAVAGEKCSSGKCFDLKSPEPKGHCCRKTDCRKCGKKSFPREKCNTKKFKAWCEGGIDGNTCPKSSCISLGDSATPSPTSSPIVPPTGSPTYSPTSLPTGSPTPSPDVASTPAPRDLDCSVRAATQIISIPQGGWNSSWKALTHDKALRASIKAVQLQVKTSGGGGNVIYILEDWTEPEIVKYTMPDGTPTVQIDLPPGSDAPLQMWIDNVQREVYLVQISLCQEMDA